MGPRGTQAFNRGDLLAGGRTQRCHTTADRFAIQMDRACAAKPHPAAEFRAGQFQFIAEIPEQRHIAVALEFSALAVYRDFDHKLFNRC